VSHDLATAAFYAALADDDPAELYDNAPCGYLSTLPDGTIIKANATFLAWTGYDRDALIGRRRFQDLLAPGDRIFYQTHAAPLLLMQGMLREIAIQVIGAAGSRLPMIMNAQLKRTADGQPLLVRTVAFDASERLSYERELMAARRRAEESEARARVLAETLQRSFLPPDIVTVPGLDVGGAYRPAGDGTEVGGDFYDVFQTGLETWGIVLGDVCGKGASAAVVTALARYTVRAEALHVSSPAAVLAGLHQALLTYYPETFITVLYLVLDQVQAGNRLTMATGGHPLPLCRRADGSIETLGRPGSFLGMEGTASVSESTALLNPGDLVVLYTDGVTEAHEGDAFFGETGIAEVLAAAAGLTAQAVADAVVAAAVAFQHGPARDDIAVVVVRKPSSLADLDDPGLDQGAVRHVQHAERAVRLAAPVGRRAGIEDPQGLVGCVERYVRVTEHHELRLGEPGPHPGQPPGGRAAVVNHRDPQALRCQRDRLGRAPGGDVGTVVVADDRGHRRVLRQLVEHGGRADVACVQDQLRAAELGRDRGRAGFPAPGSVRVRQDDYPHDVSPFSWTVRLDCAVGGCGCGSPEMTIAGVSSLPGPPHPATRPNTCSASWKRTAPLVSPCARSVITR
jgi:phosphoserine phosphatase RsbU/P